MGNTAKGQNYSYVKAVFVFCEKVKSINVLCSAMELDETKENGW